MSYTKQNFESGQILTAAKLNAMDDQIAINELIEYTGALVTTSGPTFTCSATKAQIDDTWPNCSLKFTIDGSSTYYYAYPALKTTSGYHFEYNAGPLSYRIARNSSAWSVNMKNESVPGYIGKIVVLGDDMCAGDNSWVSHLTKTYNSSWTGMNTVYNAAVVGACFDSYTGQTATSIYQQAANQETHIKEADMVIICGCYNDAQAAAAGYSAPTYSTVADGFEKVITRVKGYINATGANPKCRIVYVSYGDGYYNASNTKDWAYTVNLRSIDTTCKCICNLRGVQVIDLVSGANTDNGDFSGNFPIPTADGATKIGRAMVQKLIDRTSTIKPPKTLVLNYGTSNSPNPYHYTFAWLQWLYVSCGVDIKIFVTNQDYPDLLLPGHLVYMSKNTTSSTPAERLAIWKIEWPNATTTSVTQNTYMNQAIIQTYVQNGATTTTYNRIAHT